MSRPLRLSLLAVWLAASAGAAPDAPAPLAPPATPEPPAPAAPPASIEPAAPAETKPEPPPEAGLRAPFVLTPGPEELQPEAAASDELEQALLMVQDKRYAEAIPPLERALKTDPTFEPTWEALGWSYYYTGRPDDAARLWGQYVTLRPDSPKAYSMLSQLALLRSDWVEADRYLAESLRLDPKNYDIRYWYAQNLFRLGRLSKSQQILEELAREDDQRLDVRVDLARTYSLVQRYEESCDLWTQIVDAIPDNLDFRAEYARALLFVGSLVESDEQCRMILDEDPARWEIMNLRADIAELSQSPEVMIQSLRELMDDASDDAVRARLRMRLGARLVRLNEKRPEEWPLTMALEEFDKATDAVPDEVAWLNLYSQVALKAHQTLTVRRVVNHILEDLNPNNFQALRTRFELEMLERNYDAAEKALEDTHDRFRPDNPYRFLDLARLEVQRGRYTQAMDALDELEAIGNQGAVLTLLYHGLTESEWVALTSTRRFREHLLALQQAGFTFIHPLDIPEYLQKNEIPVERADPKPWLARQVDNMKYAFTGEPRPARRLEDLRPSKVVAVTFDDGLRNSFTLGTPIAQELKLTFGMFVIENIEELNAPMYAAWDEIREYRNTGAWQIGSHLMQVNTLKPLTSDTNHVGRTLPNRMWLPERKRLETLREWSMRIRSEFADSRARLEKELGLPEGEPLAIAYPFNDIGQDEGSNVARLVNPIRSILTEADREFQVGFLMDELGYTCPSENKLTVRRYEPPWDAEGYEVVEHVLENHPVFMARRLRAEIAVLMGKPFLAEKQIELLRRDGYPEGRLRELIALTQNRMPNRGLPADAVDREGTSRGRIRPSNAYLGAAYRENQSNEDIVQRYGEIRGGLNFSAALGAELLYRTGSIQQDVTTNIWYKVPRSETTSSQETRVETVDGTTTTSTVNIETTTVREAQTNRVERSEYDADVEEIRGAFSLRMTPSAQLVGSLGIKTLTLGQGGPADASNDEIVGGLAVAWRRMRGLQTIVGYERDLIPSARRHLAYDGLVLGAEWKVNDDWDLAFNGRYLNYADRNSMVQIYGSSFWQLFERQGIWAGLEASTYSTDEKSIYYWSPYWDTRYAAVARLRQAYLNYYFQVDLRLGQQMERAREEDESAWRTLKAQAEKDGTWYAGPDPNMPWDTFIGLGINYRQRVFRHLDLIGAINVNFLRDYSEHDFTLGLQYNF